MDNQGPPPTACKFTPHNPIAKRSIPSVLRPSLFSTLALGLLAHSPIQLHAASVVIASQNPDHYFTFDGNTTDTGNSATLATASLAGSSSVGGGSLLLSGTGNSLSVDGSGDSEVQINNDPATINGAATDNRTISFAFNATTITTTRSVLYEHGGATRGMALYVEEVGGEDRLYMAVWNIAESNWGNPPVSVFTAISEGTTYHAAFVLDGDPDGDDNTDDGNVFGYLNGIQFDSAGGAGNLRGAGNNTAFGGINENVRFHDNSTVGNGNNFNGRIDELAIWNSVLTPGQISAQSAEFIPEPRATALGMLGALLLLRRRR